MSRKRITILARLIAWGVPTVFLLVGCAGSTLGSGVGDAYLERPPYVAGGPLGVDPAALAVLPLRYQAGAAEAPLFDPDSAGPAGALLAEMGQYLDSLTAGTHALAALPGTAPDVQFGCARDGFGDCIDPDEHHGFSNDRIRQKLAVARPDGAWTRALAEQLARAGAAHALVITLEVGDYWPRQTNWRGSKAVELGAGHEVPLPWLTSLETPVRVLQLTGAVVGADGKVVRIAAEGLIARRSRLLVSAVGGQELITGEDVERLRAAVRDDLPGRPLVWRAGLRRLLAELVGSETIALH